MVRSKGIVGILESDQVLSQLLARLVTEQGFSWINFHDDIEALKNTGCRLTKVILDLQTLYRSPVNNVYLEGVQEQIVLIRKSAGKDIPALVTTAALPGFQAQYVPDLNITVLAKPFQEYRLQYFLNGYFDLVESNNTY